MSIKRVPLVIASTYVRSLLHTCLYDTYPTFSTYIPTYVYVRICMCAVL